MVMDGRRVYQMAKAVGISENEKRTFCITYLPSRRFSTRWVHNIWRLIKSTPAWSCRRRAWHFWSRSSHQFSWTFPHPRSGLGPPLRARYPTTIHAVETFFSPSKEGQGGVIGRKGGDLRLLESKGIVFVNYLQKGETVNWVYYAKLLRQLRKAIKSKRPGKLRKSYFTRTMLHTCLWLQCCCACLWRWTKFSWSPSIFSWFGTIWLSSVPQQKTNKRWGHICRLFFFLPRIRMRAFIPRNPSAAAHMESVRTAWRLYVTLHHKTTKKSPDMDF